MHRQVLLGGGRRAGWTRLDTHTQRQRRERERRGGGGGQHDRPLGDAQRIHAAPRELMKPTTHAVDSRPTKSCVGLMFFRSPHGVLLSEGPFPFPLHYCWAVLPADFRTFGLSSGWRRCNRLTGSSLFQAHSLWCVQSYCTPFSDTQPPLPLPYAAYSLRRMSLSLPFLPALNVVRRPSRVLRVWCLGEGSRLLGPARC